MDPEVRGHVEVELNYDGVDKVRELQIKALEIHLHGCAKLFPSAGIYRKYTRSYDIFHSVIYHHRNRIHSSHAQGHDKGDYGPPPDSPNRRRRPKSRILFTVHWGQLNCETSRSSFRCEIYIDLKHTTLKNQLDLTGAKHQSNNKDIYSDLTLLLILQTDLCGRSIFQTYQPQAIEER